MRRVTLTVKEDPVTGEAGLVLDGVRPPDDQPVVDGGRGIQIAHDLIEHCHGLTQIGDLQDELEALGAIWYVRGRHDDITRDYVGSALNAYQHLSGELCKLFWDWRENGAVLPVNEGLYITRPHPNDDDFNLIITQAKSEVNSECRSRCVTWQSGPWRDFSRVALSCLRRGYRYAERREKKGGRDLNSQFWEIVRAVSEFSRHEELILGTRCALYYGGGEARVQLIEEY